MIILLFTKNSSFLSKEIRWLTNTPVSHFAIAFDKALLFQSNLLGVQINSLYSFLKHSEVVFQIPLETTNDEDNKIYDDIVKIYDDKEYDFKAFKYFGYRLFLYKLFKTPLPSENPYNDDRKYLCTELGEIIPERFAPRPPSLSITLPYDLYIRYKHLELTDFALTNRILI